jgi:pimeloyl-ACP methyl ester carboxylesterase
LTDDHVCSDTGPGFKSDKARDSWNKYANETADRFDREGLSPLQEASPERSKVKHRNADGLAMAARGMLAQRNDSIINALPNIKVPSLVLVGADDTGFLAATDYSKQSPGYQPERITYSLWTLNLVVKKIPNSHKVVIPNAGHAANMAGLLEYAIS